jgi:acylphosphatase
MRAYKLLLQGKLYKTGFRFYALEKAVEFDVKGFIMYTTDRDVIIHAEGEEQNLDHFVQWCRKGMLCCKVSRADVQETVPKQYNDFKIST